MNAIEVFGDALAGEMLDAELAAVQAAP